MWWAHALIRLPAAGNNGENWAISRWAECWHCWHVDRPAPATRFTTVFVCHHQGSKTWDRTTQRHYQHLDFWIRVLSFSLLLGFWEILRKSKCDIWWQMEIGILYSIPHLSIPGPRLVVAGVCWQQPESEWSSSGLETWRLWAGDLEMDHWSSGPGFVPPRLGVMT